MAGAQQDRYDIVSHHDANVEPRRTLHSIPPNAIVVRDQVGFYHDCYETPGSGKTMFQLIKNNHEVIVWGPPVVVLANLAIQLELIETLLNSVDFDDIRQATLYIAWDGRARLIPQEQRLLQIPYFSGYRYIDESQLQVTEWLQAGWKRALLDGVRPVEVEYAYNRTSSLALQCMIDACQKLEALDLTTPVLACLTRDGRMIGIVKCIEEGARMVSYKDRALVYTAFGKMQERHIYLLDGYDMEPSTVLIVDDKVRFVDMALKRWFGPNIFIYDRTIHDEQQLKQAQQSHWRQAGLLFERISARLSTSKRYRSSEYHLVNVICAPGMPLIAFSASPLIVSQRREKRRKRSSESQISSVDGEYLPERDMSILTQRCRITLNQCGHFGRRPGPHLIINSEKSPSSLSPPSSQSVYSVPISSSMACHRSILKHHRIFYSDHSSPSQFYNGGNILDSLDSNSDPHEYPVHRIQHPVAQNSDSRLMILNADGSHVIPSRTQHLQTI